MNKAVCSRSIVSSAINQQLVQTPLKLLTQQRWWTQFQPVVLLKEMNGILCLDSALKGYIGSGTTWANEMYFVMKHAPGVGSIDYINCTKGISI